MFYFFMSNYVLNFLLCLGTDIASDAPEEVVTTVNQCLFKGEMVVGQEEGTTSVYRENVSVKNPAWVYHDKVGYLFPSGGDVIVSNPKQTGAWKDINQNRHALCMCIEKAMERSE